jgi:predicted DNA-binding transcriptional regulator YafY
MRRADRLFQIVQQLRHERLVTAAKLARHLEVSERTIYRDIADLIGAGVPIEGEAGVGYRVGKGFELPPLMFDHAEVQALVLGARMVEGWADEDLRRAARSVLAKVEAVLPSSRRKMVQDTALYALSFHVPEEARERLGPLRRAIDERHKVSFDYEDRQGRSSGRVVRPLGLFFWGATWTLGAYCELRQDHRSFRLDRIVNLAVTEDAFEHVSPVTLEDFVAAQRDR